MCIVVVASQAAMHRQRTQQRSFQMASVRSRSTALTAAMLVASSTQYVWLAQHECSKGRSFELTLMSTLPAVSLTPPYVPSTQPVRSAANVASLCTSSAQHWQCRLHAAHRAVK
jgi:hypothetical protein